MSRIASNLRNVLHRVQQAAASSQRSDSFPPRLVAVSKLKSTSDIIEAYQAGQRHFGENYVNELESKSNAAEIRDSCPDIKWHFIGRVQPGKYNKLAKIPNLYVIESVDSMITADKLNQACEKKNRPDRLRVMIQVNTSGEDQKNGVDLNSTPDLYKHIVAKCNRLELIGLMTIGSLEASLNQTGKNKDFQNLVDCKLKLVKDFSLDPNKVELSMGMSHDFEEAVKMGSSNVRVGTLIFGSR